MRCIRVGIPPALATKDAFYLLTGADGRKLNSEVLGVVGETIEVRGTAVRAGDTMILKSEPATFRRVSGSSSQWLYHGKSHKSAARLYGFRSIAGSGAPRYQRRRSSGHSAAAPGRISKRKPSPLPLARESMRATPAITNANAKTTPTPA